MSEPLHNESQNVQLTILQLTLTDLGELGVKSGMGFMTIPEKGRDFSLYNLYQTGSGSHSTFHPEGSGCSLCWVKLVMA
jgi:hypothetical protein